MRSVKVYCSLFWLLFAVVLCVEASRLEMGELNQPGSGFFPFTIGLLTGVLALISLFQLVREKREGPAAPTRGPFRWWNILVIVAALIGFTLSLEKVGFLINTFLFMVILLKVVDPQTWKRALLTGLITATASELVFNVILKAQIPSGILGF